MWLSALFSWYAASFGKFNETYGSLGAVIGFMTWLWISAIVILLGAELDAEMEHQTARDTTTGSPKPMGREGPGWRTRSERFRAGDGGEKAASEPEYILASSSLGSTRGKQVSVLSLGEWRPSAVVDFES